MSRYGKQPVSIPACFVRRRAYGTGQVTELVPTVTQAHDRNMRAENEAVRRPLCVAAIGKVMIGRFGLALHA